MSADARPVDRVLVIDDDAAQRLLLRGQLAGLDAELLEAADAASGLQIVEAVRPRVVVLDWVMPGESGLSVARTIGADPALAGVRVIMLTGLEDPRDAKLARQAGAVAYLVKPVPSELLREVVHQALRGRSGGDDGA